MMSHPFHIAAHFKQIFVPPNSPGYHPVIAGVRAVAFLWLIFFHCLFFGNLFLSDFTTYDKYVNRDPFGIFFNAGSFGVDVFFLLSGFLLFETVYKQVLASNDIHVRSLIISRIFRLSPIMIFASLLFRAAGNTGCPRAPDLLFYLNWSIIHRPELQECLTTTWTISVDLQTWLAVLGVFTVLLKIRTPKGAWSIKITDLVVLFGALSAYHVWRVFSLNPLIRENTHTRDVIMSHMQEGIQRDLNITLPYDVHDPSINAFIESARSLTSLYFSTFTRCSTLILGLIVGQLFYKHKSFVQGLHRRSLLLSPLFGAILLATLPFSCNPATYYVPCLPYIWRNLVIATHRQVFTASLGYFFLLALTGRKENTQASNVGKILNRFFSLYIWYPIAQLSYVAYVFSVPFLALVVFKLYPISADRITTLYFLQSFAIIMVPLLLFSIVIHVLVEMPAAEIRKSKFPSRFDSGKKIRKNT